ncbi:MAG: DUF1289 domain-containing protein [Gammaproteobacteria bacterium]
MVESPCRQICHIPPGLDFCIGCGRTRMDIQHWLQMSDERRIEVTHAAATRLADCERRCVTSGEH